MKTILITGASSGIGAEISKRYLEAGNRVIMISRSFEKMQKIAQYNENALILPTDIRELQEVENSINQAKIKFGKIDIAILNAGISILFEFEELDHKVIDDTYRTNFFGVTNFLGILIEIMKKQNSGKIVTIGSQADVRGFPLAGVYSSSKAALNILMESARIELSKSNIKVLHIRPGFVWTPMIEDNNYPMPFMMSVEKAAKKIVKAIDSNRKVFTFPWQTMILTQLAKYSPRFLFDILGDYKKYRSKT